MDSAQPWSQAGSQGQAEVTASLALEEPHSSPPGPRFALSAQADGYCGLQDLVPELILVGVEGFVAWELKDSLR